MKHDAHILREIDVNGAGSGCLSSAHGPDSYRMTVMRPRKALSNLIALLSLHADGLTVITRIWGNSNESIVMTGYYGNELASLDYSIGDELFRKDTGGRNRSFSMDPGDLLQESWILARITAMVATRYEWTFAAPLMAESGSSRRHLCSQSAPPRASSMRVSFSLDILAKILGKGSGQRGLFRAGFRMEEGRIDVSRPLRYRLNNVASGPCVAAGAIHRLLWWLSVSILDVSSRLGDSDPLQ